MAKHGTASQNREPVLNNITCADKLHELLQHLEETGEFVTSAQPFYVMGIGNGANIARHVYVNVKIITKARMALV